MIRMVNSMKEARLLGYTIKKLAHEKNVSDTEMQKILHCSPSQLEKVYAGRLFISFKDLQNLSSRFDVPMIDMLNGDEEGYNREIVYTNGEFSNTENREVILDIIDDYADLIEMVDGADSNV